MPVPTPTFATAQLLDDAWHMPAEPTVEPAATAQSPSSAMDDDSPPVSGKQKSARKRSCAECRRLKLKCTREWPCTNCVRRHVANLCPDGSKRTEGRAVHAREVAALQERIRELEGALAVALTCPTDQATTSNNGAASDTAFSLVSPSLSLPTLALPDLTPPEALPSIGLLSVATTGSEHPTRYFGPGSASAYLDREVDDHCPETDESDDGEPEGDESMAAAQVDGASPSASSVASHRPAFPFGTRHGRPRPAEFVAQLPPYAEVRKLVDVYYNVYAYMYEPCQRDIFESRVLPTIFPVHGTGTVTEPLHPHRLALVFATLALGALFDVDKAIKPREAEHYALVAQECLASTRFLDEPTLAAVQTLILLCLYALNAHRNGGFLTYPCIGLAVRLAQAQGLHRDPAAWNLSETECNIRRLIWQDLVILDHLQALTLGRPPATDDRHSDTPLPTAAGLRWQRDEPDGERGAFHLAKYRLSPVIGRIIERVFGIHQVEHQVVMQLDEQLRQAGADLPADLLFSETPDPTTPRRLRQQSLALAIMTNKTRLFLHRAFYLHALRTSPEEPLRSPYATSVVILLLEASRNLISVGLAAHQADAGQAARRWGPSFHSYNGGVCAAALVILSPGSLLAPFAWSELQRSLELLEALRDGVQGAELLPRLRRLEERARHSLAVHHAHAPASAAQEDFASLGSGEAKLQLRAEHRPRIRLANHRAASSTSLDGRAEQPIFDAPSHSGGIEPAVLSRMVSLVPGVLDAAAQIPSPALQWSPTLVDGPSLLAGTGNGLDDWDAFLPYGDTSWPTADWITF